MPPLSGWVSEPVDDATLVLRVSTAVSPGRIERTEHSARAGGLEGSPADRGRIDAQCVKGAARPVDAEKRASAALAQGPHSGSFRQVPSGALPGNRFA